ncbi:addiction module protein [Candidatus Falkowbacteria bacterium]|nr:addiction module protein [Candidatus Falkowbacteria bacterium]
MTKILDGILRLSVSERLTMVEAIWDSIAKNDEHVGQSIEIKQMLEDRLENHRKSPNEGYHWNDVKARITNMPSRCGFRRS